MSRFELSAPGRADIDQAWQAGVIPCTRVTPMDGFIYETSLHRIQVCIIELLQHHLVTVDLLRMVALLPELVITVELVVILPNCICCNNVSTLRSVR